MNLKEFEIAFCDARNKAMMEMLCSITTIYIGHKDYMDIKTDLINKLGQGAADFSPFAMDGPDFIWEGIPGYVVRQARHFGYQLELK